MAIFPNYIQPDVTADVTVRAYVGLYFIFSAACIVEVLRILEGQEGRAFCFHPFWKISALARPCPPPPNPELVSIIFLPSSFSCHLLHPISND